MGRALALLTVALVAPSLLTLAVIALPPAVVLRVREASVYLGGEVIFEGEVYVPTSKVYIRIREPGKGLEEAVEVPVYGGVFTAVWRPPDVGEWLAVAEVGAYASREVGFTVRYREPEEALVKSSIWEEDPEPVLASFTDYGSSEFWFKGYCLVINSTNPRDRWSYRYNGTHHIQTYTSKNLNYSLIWEPTYVKGVPVRWKLTVAGTSASPRTLVFLISVSTPTAVVRGHAVYAGRKEEGVGFDWSDALDLYDSLEVSGRTAVLRFRVPKGSFLIDPSVVGTSTSSLALGYPHQRKVFYAQGRWWVFYSDGTFIVYRTSTDGATWSSATTVRSGSGDRFTAWSNGTHVAYTYLTDTAVYYRLGRLNPGGTITWAAIEQVPFSSTDPIFQDPIFHGASIAIDAYGYAWIAIVLVDLNNYHVYLYKNGLRDGGWSDESVYYNIYFAPSLFTAVVVPLSGSTVAVVYHTEGQSLCVAVRPGSGSTCLSGYSTTRFSAVAVGSYVHIAFLSGSDVAYVGFNASSGTFSPVAVLASASSTSHPAVSVNPQSGEVSVFWVYGTAVYFRRRYAGGTWSGTFTAASEASEGFARGDALTSVPTYGNGVAVAYVTRPTSPYNVKFASSSAPRARVDVPTTVLADRWFYLNVTINDPDGVRDFVNVTVYLPGSTVLRWLNSTNSFSEYSDPSNYATLGHGTRVQLNSTAYRLSFELKLDWGFPREGIAVTARVYDASGLYGEVTVQSPFAFIRDVELGEAYVVADTRRPVYFELRATLGPGDALAPHLYDWYLDGVDDYVVVEPFTVYGWSEITIEEYLYAHHPKANTAWSKFSMFGDYWTDYPSLFHGPDYPQAYTSMYTRWYTRKPDGTRNLYLFGWFAYVNTWIQLVQRFTSTRELSFWVNGTKRYTTTIPTEEKTVLEWDPDTATYPVRYRRFVLGASTVFADHMKLSQGYIRTYSRALGDAEIAGLLNHVVPAGGLKLFLDPTFFNGTHFLDLSGSGNHGRGYGGVARVPAERTWIYTVKGLHSGSSYVHLRYFPVGTRVEFYNSTTGTLVKSVVVSGTPTAVGLVEDSPVELPPGEYTVRVRTYQDLAVYTCTGTTCGVGWYAFDPATATARVNPGSTVNLVARLYYAGTSVPVTSPSVSPRVVGASGGYYLDPLGGYGTVRLAVPGSVGVYSYTLYAVITPASGSPYVSAVNSTAVVRVDGLAVDQLYVDLVRERLYGRVVFASDGAPAPYAVVSLLGLNYVANASGWFSADLRDLEVPYGALLTPVSEPTHGVTYAASSTAVGFDRVVVEGFRVKATSRISNATWDSGRRELEFEASGTAAVYVGVWGTPRTVEVDGEVWTDWEYDASTEHVVVRNLASLVKLVWGKPEEGRGGGGIVYPPPQQVTPPPPLAVPSTPPEAASAGVAVIALVLAGAFVYSLSKPKPTSRRVAEEWRKRRRARNVRWERKGRFD